MPCYRKAFHHFYIPRQVLCYWHLLYGISHRIICIRTFSVQRHRPLPSSYTTSNKLYERTITFYCIASHFRYYSCFFSLANGKTYAIIWNEILIFKTLFPSSLVFRCDVIVLCDEALGVPLYLISPSRNNIAYIIFEMTEKFDNKCMSCRHLFTVIFMISKASIRGWVFCVSKAPVALPFSAWKPNVIL